MPAGAQSHTGGNSLIGWVTWEDVDRTVTITDTAGNDANYSVLTQPTADGVRGCMFHCTNITGHANNVVLATLSGNAPFKQIVVAQYSGLATASMFDQQNVGTSGGGASAQISTGNVTTTQADELIVVGIGVYGSLTATPGANWTEVYDPNATIKLYERIVAATGTYAVNATPAHADSIALSSSNNWVSKIATFKADVGGGAPALSIVPLIQNYRNMRVM